MSTPGRDFVILPDDYENMPDLALVSAAVAGDERAADELERRRAAAKP